MTVAASSWPFLSRAEGLGCAGEAASASPVFPLPLLSLSLAAAAGQPARPSMTVAASSWPLLSRAEGLGCAGEAASASPVFQGQLWVLAGVLGRLGGEATAVEELRLPPLPFGSLPPLPDPAAGSAARRGWWCESQIGRNLSPSALTMKENLQFGRRTCFINPVRAGNSYINSGAIKLWTIEGKRVVSSDWIDGCSNLSGSDCTTPSSSNCQRAVISTSKRKRLRVEGNSASQQEFFSEENENGKFHHWLHCPFDTSETFTIQEFISNNEDHVTQLVPTPGSDNNHLSILAAPEVKLYSRKSYLAMAAMHADGMTMRGNFGAVNFVVDRSRSIKIGNLTAGKLKEIKSKDDVDMDKNSFANMIKNEVLLGKSIPNDIYEWILALLSGEPRELLSCHIGLLEDFLGGHILMTLYDRLLDLEKDDSEAYNSVILALPQYDGWKRRPKFLRNSFLEQTFNYEDKTGKKTIYKDNVRGLLHLLRNCKRHAAISVELFSCIVGQYFRRIASDFQKAMHKVGCLQKLNLHYILS